MTIEKNYGVLLEHFKENDWLKYDLYELTSRCFYFLSAYDPDMNLRDTLEIVNKLKAEQKKERNANHE